MDDLESVNPFGHRIKPDLGIYKEKVIPNLGGRKTQTKLMILCIGLLRQISQSVNTEEPFERDTYHGRDTRGWLTVYAVFLASRLRSTHSFSVFVNQKNCRLIHWSRVIVTAEFDYTKKSHLNAFFWRLSHALLNPKNFDEEARARSTLGSSPTGHNYQVEINDTVTTVPRNRRLVISFTIPNNHIFPFSHGTRCFKAYDCQTSNCPVEGLVACEQIELEGDIYRELHEKGNRHIPKFIMPA